MRLSIGLSLALATLAAPAWEADNGDGTYTNPPLYADYPDPDIIRVGDEFYFATTTFANSPGLRILHSRDLVNWDIAAHVLPRLDGRKAYDLEGTTAYRAGVYAPSLRWHRGSFYLTVTLVGQNTRIYQATDIRGPWRHHELDRAAFDPGLFFDTDGTPYLATAAASGSDGMIPLLTLSDDLSRVLEANKIHHLPGAEGSKLLRRGEYYYLFNAVPKRLGMAISRARRLQGPWETVSSIDSPRTGGHQGAIVDLPDGTWWGFVMQDRGAIGRVTNLSPIFWQDGWPVWGTPDAPGRVPAVARKPIAGQPRRQPATSDEFDAPSLGLQWAWNHNPDPTLWSLTERPGHLRLKATRADSFWMARNTLTQKGQGPYSHADLRLDLSGLARGDRCGFGTLGKVNAHIAATRNDDGTISLQMNVIVDGGESHTPVPAEPLDANAVTLRTEMDVTRARGRVAYRTGGTWRHLGDEFELTHDWRTGTFQGPQYAIFCFNPGRQAGQQAGHVDVDWFHFSDRREDLPAAKEPAQ